MLEKSLFEHPNRVTCSEMNAISWAFYKEFMRDLDRDEVYRIPQFFVRKVKDVDELNQLVSLSQFFLMFFLSKFANLSFK